MRTCRGKAVRRTAAWHGGAEGIRGQTIMWLKLGMSPAGDQTVFTLTTATKSPINCFHNKNVGNIPRSMKCPSHSLRLIQMNNEEPCDIPGQSIPLQLGASVSRPIWQPQMRSKFVWLRNYRGQVTKFIVGTWWHFNEFIQSDKHAHVNQCNQQLLMQTY